MVSVALAHVLATCAPRVGPLTMRALIVYESGARPFAIADNTTRRSYFPTDAPTARVIVRRLLAAGHNVDVGYAQVNSSNFRAYGLDVATALEPCANVRTGARILAVDYANARRRYPASSALAHALSAYNTGGFRAGLRYASRRLSASPSR